MYIFYIYIVYILQYKPINWFLFILSTTVFHRLEAAAFAWIVDVVF